MIKIQEHINRPNPEKYIHSLATELWEHLNPLTRDGYWYIENSIMSRCNKYKYLASQGDANYLLKYAANDKSKAKKHARFFNYLLQDYGTNLKKIITVKPKKIDQIITNVSKILKPDDLYYYQLGKIKQTAFGKLLSEEIFGYKKFRRSNFCSDLFSRMNLSNATCPYCNYTVLHILKISSKSSVKAYLDLDHFYSKSMHPYLSVSFYNLIPSCHSCNSSDKGDKPFTIATHIHPYNEAFDDQYTFKLPLYGQIGIPKSIMIEKTGNKMLDKTLEDILLVERYSEEYPRVKDLINYYENNKHLVGTSNQQDFYDSIFVRFNVPKYRKDILKNPKSKLFRDILKATDEVNNYLQIQ